MRLYVVTTGTLFALRAPVHLARLFAEGWRAVQEPCFSIATPLAVGMQAGLGGYRVACRGAVFRWRAGVLRTPTRWRQP
jgi:hypothetical protein